MNKIGLLIVLLSTGLICTKILAEPKKPNKNLRQPAKKEPLKRIYVLDNGIKKEIDLPRQKKNCFTLTKLQIDSKDIPTDEELNKAKMLKEEQEETYRAARRKYTRSIISSNSIHSKM